MVIIKSQNELELMKTAGEIGARALQIGGESCKAGVTTAQIDKIIHDFIVSKNATPSFLGHGGFKGSACISINDEVIHGIPGSRTLKDGDFVSIDVGAYIGGFHSDNAATFAVGKISEEEEKFLKITKESLDRAVAKCTAGNRIGDISAAVETLVREHGYGLITDYTGHGIGRDLHEEPSVPNYGRAGRGPRLQAGMVIAIEPMTTMQGDDVDVLSDDWTVVSASGRKAAHFEYTVAITKDGPLILTPAYYEV